MESVARRATTNALLRVTIVSFAVVQLWACSDESGGMPPDAADAEASIIADASAEPVDSLVRPIDKEQRDAAVDGVVLGQAPPADCSGLEPSHATLTLTDGVLPDQATWSGVVHVIETVHVSASTITIEPGTTFFMDADTAIEFGSDWDPVRVIARGTAERPIRFCGKEATPGYWRGLVFGEHTTSGSVLERVTVAHAGTQGAGVQFDAPVTATNLTVLDSSTDGVHAKAWSAGSSGLSVRGAIGHAAVLLDPAAVTHFPLGGQFDGNGENTIRLRFGEIDTNTVFANAGIPYVQEDAELRVTDGAEVVFEAGVEYRFASDTALSVGWNGNDATIQVRGTEQDPVVFQGEEPMKGYWHGITIHSDVRSTSRIAHARILHGGGEEHWALECLAQVTLEHVALQDNARSAYVREPLNADSSHLSITGTEGTALTVSAVAMPTVPIGGNLTGNAADLVDVVRYRTEVVTIVGTIPDAGVPYRLRDSISLKEGSDVVIAPGAELVVAADRFLEVGWNGDAARLVAVGTEENPIVFRGEQSVAGTWDGVLIQDSANADSRLDHVQIHDAGKTTRAALRLYRPIAVTNSSFSGSLGYGILKQDSDATAYDLTNNFSSNATGSVGTF